MAKRMWKARFVFYLWLIALPQLAFALTLLIAPAQLTNLAFAGPVGGASAAATDDSPADAASPEAAILPDALPAPASPDAAAFLARLLGIACLALVMILLAARNNPGQFRDVFFWLGALHVACAALALTGPFWFGLRWLAAVPAALIWLAGGGFLLAFASRNLLVRE